MANSGYKQATVAYKIDVRTREPLDVEGQPVAISGNKQAIRLLIDAVNPDPTRYEVESYFAAGEIVGGQPTKIWAPYDCPSGDIYVTPQRITLAPSSEPIFAEVVSSGPWTVSPSSGLVTFSQTSGEAGRTYVEIVFGAAEGQQDFIFTNTQSGRTATLRVILSNDFSRWILATGFWDNMGFWINSETWNY